MTTKYPQYRVTRWIDTSEEAMNLPQASITYGVQTMREKGSKWMHVSRNGEALFFETHEAASAACAELRKSAAVAA